MTLAKNKKCKSKYHEGLRDISIESFTSLYANRCANCVKLTEQHYRNSDKSKARWRKYYDDNREVITARSIRQHYDQQKNDEYLFMCAYRRSKRTGIEFTITREDVKIPELCPVLGIPLYFSNARTPNTPSLDRIDNSRGYVKGNTAVISWRANFMKRDLSLDEIQKLYTYMTGYK